MALPDLGIVPTDVREAVTDPFWMPLGIGGGALRFRRVRPGPRGAVVPETGRHRNDGNPRSGGGICSRRTQEVPVLEKPPVIGVVEDVDGPSRGSTIFDAHAVNVLGESARGKIQRL
jgi:hypothetical protein